MTTKKPSFIVSLAIIAIAASALLFGGYFQKLPLLAQPVPPGGQPPAAPGGPSGWTDDGAAVRLTDSADQVGIGTVNPTEKLDVIGNIALSGFIDGIDLSVKALDWDTAFNERRQWDGSATNLGVATGRTSLGLGSLAVLNSVSGGVGGTIGDKTIVTDDLGVLNHAIFKDTDGTGCHKITFNSTGTLNAILVDCATGEPPPPPPPPPSGVVFFENFNSYTDGNLGGQGDWTTPNTVNWIVNSVSPIEGLKDLKVTGTTDTLGVAFVAINDSVGTTGNLVTATWRFRINNVSAGGGRGLTVILRNSLNQDITDISFAVSQPIIGMRHNGDFVPFREINLDQVYKVTVEYDKLNNQYRMRIDDGPFSSFGPLSDTLANGSNVEKLLIGSDRINGSTFIDELIIQQQ